MASKELFTRAISYNFRKDLETAIETHDAHAFRNLLLNKVKRLALAVSLERDLLGTICDYKLTHPRLTMQTTLFHPKEFGGPWITTKHFPVFSQN